MLAVLPSGDHSSHTNPHIAICLLHLPGASLNVVDGQPGGRKIWWVRGSDGEEVQGAAYERERERDTRLTTNIFPIHTNNNIFLPGKFFLSSFQVESPRGNSPNLSYWGKKKRPKFSPPYVCPVLCGVTCFRCLCSKEKHVLVQAKHLLDFDQFSNVEIFRSIMFKLFITDVLLKWYNVQINDFERP